MPALGAIPHADFLPHRIRALHEIRRNRHNLAIASLAVACLCALSAMLANAQLFASETRLSLVETQTADILTQQNHYSDIVELINDSANLNAASTVVSEKEVDWATLLRQIKGSIPASGSLVDVSLTAPASNETPTITAPLTGQDILVSAKVGMSVPSFQDVEFFLLDARQWDGYSNATITSMVKKPNGYVATVVVNLGIGALEEVKMASAAASAKVTK